MFNLSKLTAEQLLFSMHDQQKSLHEFVNDITQYRARINQYSKNSDVNSRPLKALLFHPDPYQFSVRLFALSLESADIYFPSNGQVETLNSFTSVVSVFAGSAEQNMSLPTLESLKVDNAIVHHCIDEEVAFNWPTTGNLYFSTSGSTGQAKVIHKSWGQLNLELIELQNCFNLTVNHTIISTVSHQHIYGLLFRLLWPLSVGAQLGDTFEYPEHILSALSEIEQVVLVSSPAFLKRLINVRPNIYSFLNENVRKKMWFTKNINYITRGMGVDDIGLEKFIDQPKIFDVVYCGSNRTGLFNEIKRIADMGLTVALIGPSEQIEHRNITSFGRRLPSEVKELITQCRYGLNYTPDVFPFNIQDSTKVIEYSAYNLGVITNRYQWIDDFERERSANFMNLESLKTKKDLDLYPFVIPNVADLFWGDLIDRTGLVNKIRAL